ncbi:hypothetical protein SAMN05216214_107103 [Atopomonas hussainii]|uniref:Uncharacterized protein n=1 Tax=Atopomonas hussainii TaxID=1429083 RepID=A0A1H7LT96_9GAMM|nr:hypothetical protein SAMN05216214_107103 [Atopomonas hussainii]
MNKSVFGVGGVLVVLLVGGFAWQRDDALSPEAEGWLKQFSERPKHSDAYLYLNGLDAPADEEPAELGAARLAHYQQWLATSEPSDQYWELQQATLPLPQGPAFCAREESACWRDLFASDPSEVLAEHAVLLERYRHLMTLDDYATLTSPTLSDPLPPFFYLRRGHQLQALYALQLAKSGAGSEALRLLESDLVQLRRQLAQADHLVLKMILIAMLDEHLNWLALLYREGLIVAPQPIQPLSESERSLHLALQREFAGSAEMYAQLGAGDLGSGEPKVLEHVALVLVYKPQMTINRALLPYQTLSAVSLLKPAAFRQSLENDRQKTAMERSWRNYVGVVLSDIALPDFNIYIGRVLDLDAKFKLLNLLPQLPKNTPPSAAQLAALEQADNPYQRGQLPFWQADIAKLCYPGPLPQHKGSRCL